MINVQGKYLLRGWQCCCFCSSLFSYLSAINMEGRRVRKIAWKQRRKAGSASCAAASRQSRGYSCRITKTAVNMWRTFCALRPWYNRAHKFCLRARTECLRVSSSLHQRAALHSASLEPQTSYCVSATLPPTETRGNMSSSDNWKQETFYYALPQRMSTNAVFLTVMTS